MDTSGTWVRGVKLGETLAKRLALEVPEADQPAFLALMEQRARSLGDLWALRELQAYRQGLARPDPT